MKRRFSCMPAFALALFIFPLPAIGQSSTLQTWSGSIQCQLDVQTQGYVRHEIQTWTLTGEPPIAAGGTGVPVYPATWKYTGQGQLQRMDGARSTMAQWSIDIVPGEAPLSIYARDGVLIIKRASAQQKRYQGFAGQRQVALNGVPQQPTPLSSFTLWEWALPWIEATPGGAVNGTMQVRTEATSGEIQQPGPPPFATCKYQLSKTNGPAGLTPASQDCPGAADISQTFDGMKANLAHEFDTLIQHTQDPARHAALTAQKQRMLDELENLKQQNNRTNLQACQGTHETNTSQNTGRGGAPSTNTKTNSPGPNSNNGQSRSGRTQTASGANPPSTGMSSPSTPAQGSADSNSGDCGTGTENPGPVAALESNHSIAQAAALGTFSSGQTKSKTGNLISPTDSTFYLFNIQPDSSATVKLGGLDCGSDFDLYVYRAVAPYSSVVTSSTSRGSISKQVLVDYDNAGFLVEVRAVSWNPANPRYTLNLTVASAATAAVTDVQMTRSAAPEGARATAKSNPGNMVTAPGKTPAFAGVKPTKQLTAITTASSPGSGSASTQPPASGRYLVTMTGLWCAKTTQDDPLDFDGRGDEIYAAAFVRKYDRATGQNVLSYSRQTLVYGDSNRSDRIQAGSQTPAGGIRAFDSIPDGATADRRLPPQDNGYFPYKLWGGTLTDGGDALIISPSIWESDGKPALFYQWHQNQNDLNAGLFLNAKVQDQITAKKFEPVTLGASVGAPSEILGTVASKVGDSLLLMVGIPPLSILTNGGDRPIGLVANGQAETALPHTAVVLTREIIETALAGPYAPIAPTPVPVPTPKAGIMTITFSDRVGLQGTTSSYVMALQVERCEGSLAQFCSD